MQQGMQAVLPIIFIPYVLTTRMVRMEGSERTY